MGLKKYEIITVGGDKRVRALRSWAVGDRYVNIGDVGGIVYDEKTLSQDGACWLFRGNFGFPGARIGGDSIVDVGEAALSAAGAPNVDILGSSVVVGSKLQFASEQTAADIMVLTAADFEQGGYEALISKTPLTKVDTTQYVRPKNLFFAGGKTVTLKCEVPGYTVTAIAVDRDGNIILNSPTTATGEGVTITAPAGQYFTFRMSKDPTAVITPAEAALAQITFTGTYETKLSIVDSRVEINPVTSTRISSIKPGGRVVGGSYPEAIIRNSKVSVNASAAADATARLMGQIIESNVTLDVTAGEAQLSGIYSNVKNLTVSGILSVGLGAPVYNAIQATDCDNFVTSPGVFPGYAAGISANMPFIFQGCNVPNGLFYHHAQIANTYKNIDFALAQADLGKTIGSGLLLASSEVEGMYRIYFAVFGALVESYDSVKSLNMADLAKSYGTTIYKDAYFKGLFDIAGTNVFGNTKRHDTQEISGCKIVNTGATAVNMKGNIRVEGNATLTNCSIIGSGYFGGNSAASRLFIAGSVFMNDNAKFTKTGGTNSIRNLRITENGSVTLGDVTGLGVVQVADNAVLSPIRFGSSECDLFMTDNAVVTSSVSIAGVLKMRDNARVSEGELIAYGDITLCGSYNQTANKTWTGKRVIDNENAPEYDNNVKTKYDF
nr:MAG TPA: Putative transferase, nesg, ydcK, Structural Genomics.38A [Caudoviricetes sp.]